jgi:hypothetical protein
MRRVMPGNGDFEKLQEDRKKLEELLRLVYEEHGLETVLSAVTDVLRSVGAKPLPGQLHSAAVGPLNHAITELLRALRMERDRNVIDDRPW